jgi:hypothetical protein
LSAGHGDRDKGDDAEAHNQRTHDETYGCIPTGKVHSRRARKADATLPRRGAAMTSGPCLRIMNGKPSIKKNRGNFAEFFRIVRPLSVQCP